MAAKAVIKGASAPTPAKIPPLSADQWARVHTFAPPVISPDQAIQQSISHARGLAHLAPQLYTLAGIAGAVSAVDGSTPLSKDGSVEVTVTGTAAARAARAAGARVLAAVDGAATITLAPSQLRTLALAPGVDMVAPANRAISKAVTAESVHTSLADSWQTGGQTGAGAVIAVVDDGFANLLASGTLPSTQVVTGNHCADVNADSHGTATAEIVHEMAPGATLLLYCVDDVVGLAQAASELQAAGAQIVSCSLGFTPDARGDGTGTASTSFTSADLTVAKVRKAGILWVNASGNEAQDHWSGTFADRNRDGFADLNTATDNYDQVVLPVGAATVLALTWDQWPATTIAANIRVDVVDAVTGKALGYAVGNAEAGVPNGPVRLLTVANTGAVNLVLDIRVSVPQKVAAVRYDLSYLGDVSASYYSSIYPARAAAGSVSEPAASPYAMAVGAAYWANGAIETYSSRGPTVDGRVKPDLIGFDGVSSNIYGASTGNENADLASNASFFGTSAAAPNVAGAAALLKAANPALDASQLQALLQEKATHPTNPPSNTFGNGLLSLASITQTSGPAGTAFSPIRPARVLDTRTTVGGHRAPLAPGSQLLVSASSRVPADATAVVINLTGVGATGPTFLSVFPNGNPGTSNLNLTRSDPTAAVSATVALNANHQFWVRNSSSRTDVVIDVVGYYAPAGAGYGPVSPYRLLDTRTAVGRHYGPVKTYGVVRVSVATDGQIPANATAVTINLTATNVRGSGFVSTGAASFTGTSTLNYSRFTRANLAIVGLSNRSFLLRNIGSSVDLIADVVGYYSPAAPGKFHVLPSPVRLTDTRTGLGGLHSSLSNGARATVAAGGLNGIPYLASAADIGVTAVPAADGVLAVFPSGQSVPRASTLNYTNGRIVPNAAVTGLGATTFAVRNTGRSVNVVVDAFGYFSAN